MAIEEVLEASITLQSESLLKKILTVLIYIGAVLQLSLIFNLISLGDEKQSQIVNQTNKKILLASKNKVRKRKHGNK